MNLIEEAAKAILDVAEMPESVRNERVCEWARRDARAALAVFEKAEAEEGWEYLARGDQWNRWFGNPDDAEKWRHRGYVIFRRRKAVQTGFWEQVPDTDTTPKEEA